MAHSKWADIRNGKLSPEQIAASDRKVARTIALKPFYYAVTVQWSEEDAVYVARVPTLSIGCAAHGDSLYWFHNGAEQLVDRFGEAWRVASDSVHPTLEAAMLRAEELARGEP